MGAEGRKVRGRRVRGRRVRGQRVRARKDIAGRGEGGFRVLLLVAELILHLAG